MVKIFSILLIAFIGAQAAGSFSLLNDGNGFRTYCIKPQCKKQASDTIGPIDLNYAKNFSLSFAFNRLTFRDTSIVDSGFRLFLMQGATISKSDMVAISTTDSIVRPFNSNDSMTIRTRSISKGLTLDAMRYLWLIFKRYDSNSDTLDFKKGTGVIDSTIVKLNLYREK